ncbi:hypothetical protein Tco_1297462 [Tanacetum coccineum]
MMDTKRLPYIRESFGDLPDVSELHPSVFLDDVEANNMNVYDLGRSSSMQQNTFEVSIEEFKGGRVYRGIGSSNPNVNANVEGVRTNVSRGTGLSKPVLNIVPKVSYGSTSSSPYVAWLEEHYRLLMINNTELYNRVEKLSSKKAVLECQVNEFKGKHLTCKLYAARYKAEA